MKNNYFWKSTFIIDSELGRLRLTCSAVGSRILNIGLPFVAD